MYTTTITKSGQITLTKSARELLGVKLGDRLTVKSQGSKIIIEPRQSDEEFLKELDCLKSPESLSYEQHLPGEYRGKSTSEMIDIWANSTEGQKYLEESHA